VGTIALPSCADLVPTGAIRLERSQHDQIYLASQATDRKNGLLSHRAAIDFSGRSFFRAAYLKACIARNSHRSSPRVVHQMTFFLRRPPSSFGLK
jgi:hypothetical protein